MRLRVLLEKPDEGPIVIEDHDDAWVGRWTNNEKLGREFVKKKTRSLRLKGRSTREWPFILVDKGQVSFFF